MKIHVEPYQQEILEAVEREISTRVENRLRGFTPPAKKEVKEQPAGATQDLTPKKAAPAKKKTPAAKKDEDKKEDEKK